MEVEQQSRRQLERRVRLARELRPVFKGLGLSAMSTSKAARGRQSRRGTGEVVCQPVLKGQLGLPLRESPLRF